MHVDDAAYTAGDIERLLAVGFRCDLAAQADDAGADLDLELTEPGERAKELTQAAFDFCIALGVRLEIDRRCLNARRGCGFAGNNGIADGSGGS